MKRFQYLKLNIAVGLFLAAFSSNVIADETLSQEGEIAKNFTLNKLKDGTYEAYTLLDRWQVTAAMIAQPSRLDSVGFGTIYEVHGLTIDDKVSAAFYTGILSGEIALLKPQADGKFTVDKAIAVEIPGIKMAEQMKCDFVDPGAANSQEKCREALQDWLTSEQSKNFVLMSAEAKFAGIKPMAKVVNWNAKP